jgi:hypothetical protein
LDIGSGVDEILDIALRSIRLENNAVSVLISMVKMEILFKEILSSNITNRTCDYNMISVLYFLVPSSNIHTFTGN